MNLWKSPDLNSQPKQDQQEDLTRTMSRCYLNISKDGSSTASLGNWYQFLANLTTELSPDIQKETSVFQCVPIASCPLVINTEESLALSSLNRLSLQAFIYTDNHNPSVHKAFSALV